MNQIIAISLALFEISGRGPIGGHVLSLLDGVTEKPSWWAPNRAARKWMSVDSDKAGRNVSIDELGRRVRFNPEFSARLYDVLKPGDTIIVTDQPAVRKASRDFTILTN